MGKFIYLFISLIVGLGYIPVVIPAYANNLCPPGFESLCKIDMGNNPNFIGNIVQFLMILAISLSVIFLVLGGIKWIMSGGDKGKVEQARSAIIASIIGLVISLLAYFIVSVVVTMLTGRPDLNLPVQKLVP